MATPFETTVSATEFKAKCLELMDAGASRKLDRIHVTKRGKPFVTLTVVTDDAPLAADALFGCMKGQTNIPEDFDWEASPYSEADLDEMDRRFAEKFAHLL
ncbi:hypothetical protein IP88_02160 [alpha proteobacterium AAP81b]|nr:hypothetical protein IP88_02160 [alpha proteobacterium AAP81b]